MRISQKLDYASRAMVHLARKHDGHSVVRVDDIAESEAIPPSFLSQILNELKRSGLITSRRGKTGGWRLVEEPAKVSLLNIVEVLEPEALGNATEGGGESSPAVAKVWNELSDAGRKILESHNLESMCSEEAPMFYI